MKKLRDTAPTRSPKFLLHQQLSGFDTARPLTRVHASELTKPEGFCPRYYALHDVTGKKPKDRWLTAADVITYGMGNATQDTVVETFADMQRAVGHWKCRNCNTSSLFCTRPLKCDKCGCRVFKAEEVRFESAVSGASCGVDLLLKTGDPKLRVIEIKTMIKDQFQALLAPLSEHRLRTSLYLRIIAESSHTWVNMIDTSSAIVLYICKGGYIADPMLKKWGLTDTYSPFKEYTVTRDDNMTESATARAKVVKDFRAKIVGMPRGICANALQKRATQCSMKSICFAGEHPPEYDWTDK